MIMGAARAAQFVKKQPIIDQSETKTKQVKKHNSHK